MPVAQPNNIPIICDEIKAKKPKTVLDVGCGFGMYGLLARIYSVLWTADITVKQYQNWRNLNRVDAIEVYAPWITDLQRMIYNNIYIGDVREKIKEVGKYDLIIFADVLEHLTKEDGQEVLKIAKTKAKTVIISMPKYFDRGHIKGGNKWELHEYVWDKKDFGTCRIKENGNHRTIIYD